VAAPFSDALAALDHEPDLVRALLAARRLAEVTSATDPATALGALTGRLHGPDELVALGAVEALARVPDDAADRLLVDLLDDPRPALREHAAWRLVDRFPTRRALGRLVRLVADGGFTAMIAQSTLVAWGRLDPDGVVCAVDGALALARGGAERGRLVDLLGAVPGPVSDALLVRMARDPSEEVAARIAAVGALAERDVPGVDRVLTAITEEPGDLGAHAALALDDRSVSGPASHAGERHSSAGLHVAQLTLVGDLDGQLSRGGTGDTGGVASLLVSASAALARHPDVDHVLTIGRGSITDVVAGQLAPDEDGEGFAAIALGAPGRVVTDLADAWEHRLTVERGVRRALRHRPHVDALHLRMADVGTLAASTVARALGVPVVFSLAPDPHGVVRSLQAQGRVDRTTFARLDQDLHVWFRARLVEQLAREAAGLALFPRLDPDQVLVDLGLDPDEVADRARVVPEGVDVRSVRLAERDVVHPSVSRAPAVVAELARRLPAHRHGRPILLTAGRLHPVKGVDRVVAAWAGDPALRERYNLVIVGGDLDAPSPTERTVLDAIGAAVGSPVAVPAVDGLVLLGGRPRADVARLMAVAQHGHGAVVAPGGVYANGALKEEFGLALLEAMAVGLAVVAPAAGGPATYVVDGWTGVLVPPDADLTGAIHRASALVHAEGRGDAARDLVAERYSIDAMADRLAQLYQPAPVGS